MPTHEIPPEVILAVARGLAVQSAGVDTRWIDEQENALEFVYQDERYRLTVEPVGAR